MAVLTPLVLDSSPSSRSPLDIPGAVLGTGGLLAIVLGVVRTGELGWTSAEVIGLLIAGVLMLAAAFVLVEARSKSPLVPPPLFRSRAMGTSMIALAVNARTTPEYTLSINSTGCPSS